MILLRRLRSVGVRTSSADVPVTPLDGDGDGAGAVEGLGAAVGGQGGAAGRAESGPCTCADALGEQDVEGCGSSCPAVLVAVGGDPGGEESDVGQCAGEPVQEVRVRADVDHGVDIVGRTQWSLAAFGAVQVHELAADEGPPVVEALVQVEQCEPGRCLFGRHGRQGQQGQQGQPALQVLQVLQAPLVHVGQVATLLP